MPASQQSWVWCVDVCDHHGLQPSQSKFSGYVAAVLCCQLLENGFEIQSNACNLALRWARTQASNPAESVISFAVISLYSVPTCFFVHILAYHSIHLWTCWVLTSVPLAILLLLTAVKQSFGQWYLQYRNHKQVTSSYNSMMLMSKTAVQKVIPVPVWGGCNRRRLGGVWACPSLVMFLSVSMGAVAMPHLSALQRKRQGLSRW